MTAMGVEPISLGASAGPEAAGGPDEAAGSGRSGSGEVALRPLAVAGLEEMMTWAWTEA